MGCGPRRTPELARPTRWCPEEETRLGAGSVLCLGCQVWAACPLPNESVEEVAGLAWLPESVAQMSPRTDGMRMEEASDLSPGLQAHLGAQRRDVRWQRGQMGWL